MGIHSAFLAALNRDRSQFVKPWMVSWSYQDRKSSAYEAHLPQDFSRFDGPDDLRRWVSWTSEQERTSYLDEKLESRLTRASMDVDSRIFRDLNLDPPVEDRRLEIIGRANAQDFILAQPYDVPPRFRPNRILDFGAGFGRQANLWFQERPQLVYIGIDAIPLSYCLQHLYYTHTAPRLSDYVLQPDSFSISTEEAWAYHVPTWRMDLIPSDSLDLVICVQVLPELGRRLLRHVLSEFHRVLKPGGAIYLRDHDRAWRPGHGVKTDDLLRATGFELEFRAHIIDRKDLWGIPRIWRKSDPDVVASQARTGKTRLHDWKNAVDGLTGGLLGRGYRKLSNRGMHKREQ